MKTEDLIGMLAAGAEPVAANVVPKRLAMAVAGGTVAAMALMLLFLGVRPDLTRAAGQADFWVKFIFVAALALLGLTATLRTAKPGSRLGRLAILMPVPVVAIWGLGLLAASRVAPEQWGPMLLGETWKVCPLLISMLSVPLLVGTFWAAKEFAPTNLRVAGASAGLASGAVAAMVYCLHCPEMEPAFVGVWYLLGIAIPTVVGGAIAPRLLSW